ncbi:histidine phosphotransferase family protein [Rhodobacteraceae bacterium]|nr:histidine phosphotransferase family protein [Paracoccaceae bacterium]
MKHDPLQLATLIGSRICHDLASPICAVKNGLELLHLSSENSRGPEISLIEESSDNAIGQINFFRIAFGMGSKHAELSPDRARNILSPLFNGSRVVLSWSIETNITRIEAQAIFLSILCLETAMSLGGEIHLGRQKDKTTVKGSSSNFSQNPELWNSLLQPSKRHDIAPAHVHFLLLPLICQQMEKPINLDQSADNKAVYIRF